MCHISRPLLYSPRVFDQRPFQMWQILGLWGGKTFSITRELSSSPPTVPGAFSCTISFRTRPEPPCDFSVFLYFIAITQLSRTSSNSEERKPGADKPLGSFAVISTAITIVVSAWSSFVRNLGFEDVHSMIFPYFSIDSATGQVFLLPDPARLLSSPYRYKIMAVEQCKSVTALSVTTLGVNR